MADLESRVEKLEEKIQKIELDITGSLNELKLDMIEIKDCLKSNSNDGDLKNQLIEKDVQRNTARIKKLENNQMKFVWLIIGEVVTVVGTAIVATIQIM